MKEEARICPFPRTSKNRPIRSHCVRPTWRIFCDKISLLVSLNEEKWSYLCETLSIDYPSDWLWLHWGEFVILTMLKSCDVLLHRFMQSKDNRFVAELTTHSSHLFCCTWVDNIIVGIFESTLFSVELGIWCTCYQKGIMLHRMVNCTLIGYRRQPKRRRWLKC